VGAVDSMIPLATAVLHAGSTEPERVLEVECGEGEGALFLAREFPRARVRGVDSSADDVGRATARVGLDPEGRIAFKVGDPRQLPFPDDHFDLVVQGAGRLAVEETARVLRPGGRFLIVRSERASRRRGMRRRWIGHRLRRSGFELVEEGGAGGGSFFVMRLGEAVPGQPSD
jgi:ubiquinone/menaquinone biosynthesis C-methylase UbiE